MKGNNSKTLLLFVLAATIINSTVMAQKKKKYKEVSIIKQSEIINVSADALWNIIKEFDNVGIFFSSIDHAEGIGEPEFKGATCSERICYVSIRGYSEIHEKLTLFNPQKKELAYELTSGGPSFLIFAGNHWSIEAVGNNQSILKMKATMRLKRFMGFLFGGKLKRTIERQLPNALNELKIYAETGNLHPAKKKRVAKLKKKNIVY